MVNGRLSNAFGQKTLNLSTGVNAIKDYGILSMANAGKTCNSYYKTGTVENYLKNVKLPKEYKQRTHKNLELKQ